MRHIKIIFSLFLFLVFFNSAGIALAQTIAEPVVGETVILNKFNDGFFVGYEPISATCQEIGDHLYVYTEDAQVNDISGAYIDNVYTLFAATTWGVFKSEDMGANWEYIGEVYDVYDDDPTDAELTAPLGETFIKMNPDGTILLAGTNNGMYYSKDMGGKWNSIRSMPAEEVYYDVVFDTTNGNTDKLSGKYFGTGNGLYYRYGTTTLTRQNMSMGMPIEANKFSAVYDMHLLQDSTLFLATSIGPFSGIEEDKKRFSWDPILKNMVSGTVIDDSITDAIHFELQESYDGYSIGLGSHIFAYDPVSGARWASSAYQGFGYDQDSNEVKFVAFDINEDNLYFEAGFEGEYADLDMGTFELFISAGSAVTQIERAADGTLYLVSESGVGKLTPQNTFENLGLDTLQVNDLLLHDGELWAATNVGLYTTGLSTIDWQLQTPKLTDGLGVVEVDYDVSSIHITPDGDSFLGNIFGGVAKNSGETWMTTNKGLIYRGTALSDIHKVVASFDSSCAADPTKGIFQQTTEYFGDAVNSDGLDKVFLLITDLIDTYFMQAGNGIDYTFSRFDPIDQQAKTDQLSSNQRDILYLDNYPLQISTEVDEAGASLAHSLARMILYNYDTDEDEWLAEGLAMWSRWINGYKFYNNPDEAGYLDLTSLKPKDRNNILVWGDSDNLMREREESFVVFNYIFEKYFLTAATVSQFVADEDNGVTSLEKYFGGKTFNEVYIDFGFTLFLDQLGDTYLDGEFALENIELQNRSLPLSWGLFEGTSSPYSYVFPGYAWYFYDFTFYNNGLNFAPELDSVMVFNGDDNTEFTVYVIQQKGTDFDTSTFVADDIKIDQIVLDGNNRGTFVPDVIRSDVSGGTYTKVHLMVITDSPATVDGGSFTIHNEVISPQQVAFYPMQHNLVNSYFEIYAFSDEKLYADGGYDYFVEEGEMGQGPLIEATNGTQTSQIDLNTFFTDETDDASGKIFVYSGLFDLDSLLVGESGEISFTETAEDIAGNPIEAINVGPLTYKLSTPDQAFYLSDADENFKLQIDQGLRKESYITQFMVDRHAAAGLEKEVSVDNIGDTYIIGPVGRAVNKAQLSISYADMEVAELANLGIYLKQGSDWVHVETVRDPVSKTLTAKIDYLGEYRIQTGEFQSTVKELLPVAYNLEQNYPNPFNPSTVIRYQLPADNKVVLDLYNVLGQKVVTLVDKFQTAGTYSYNLNVLELNRPLSTGVYFYSIKAGKFNEIKKMLLVK